jgi:hypothetical protein
MVVAVASALRRNILLLLAFALIAGGCRGTRVVIGRDDSSALGVPARNNAYLSLAADGDRVAAAWAASDASGTDIYAAFSADGGAHFGAPVRVNDVAADANAGGEQPPRIVIRDRRVDVVWVSKHDGVAAIRVAASADGGATFGTAKTITPAGLTGARGWESAALSDDGALHAVWLDGRHSAPAPSGLRRDSAPSAPQPAQHVHTGAPMRQDIYHAVWRGNDPAVETEVATNVCFCCKTAIVSRGQDVFVAWRHLFDGGVRDIAVARSADGGATFSAPVRVSDDNWKIDACPDDGPAMAVDASSALHVIWPTLVHDPDGDRMAIFESSSTDGAATFAPRRRVDTATASAAHPRIAVGAAGTAVVWDELASGHRRSWMRIDGGAPTSMAPSTRANYPAVAATAHGFVAGWTEQDGERAVLRTRTFAR